MKITIIGSGYVGLTTGTCLAELGNNVTCLDIDQNKIDSLNNGKIPIYEPGLKELLERNMLAKRILFTTNPREAIESSDVIFLCVGTPQNEIGKANLEYIFSAAKTIAENMNCYKIIATKSTVPVGTANKIKEIIKEKGRNSIIPILLML